MMINHVLRAILMAKIESATVDHSKGWAGITGEPCKICTMISRTCHVVITTAGSE